MLFLAFLLPSLQATLTYWDVISDRRITGSLALKAGLVEPFSLSSIGLHGLNISLKAKKAGFIYAAGQSSLVQNVEVTLKAPNLLVLGFTKKNHPRIFKVLNEVVTAPGGKAGKYRRLQRKLTRMADAGLIRHDFRILLREQVNYQTWPQSTPIAILPDLIIHHGVISYVAKRAIGTQSVKIDRKRKQLVPPTETVPQPDSTNAVAPTERVPTGPRKKRIKSARSATSHPTMVQHHQNLLLDPQRVAILYSRNRAPIWLHHLHKYELGIGIKPLLYLTAKRLTKSRKEMQLLSEETYPGWTTWSERYSQLRENANHEETGQDKRQELLAEAAKLQGQIEEVEKNIKGMTKQHAKFKRYLQQLISLDCDTSEDCATRATVILHKLVKQKLIEPSPQLYTIHID